MQERKHYLLKVDDKTNRIIEFVEANVELDKLMEMADEENESAPKGIRFLPFPSASREPRIGADASDEMKEVGRKFSEESKDDCFNGIDVALRMLMAVDMTIKGTHQVPVPGMTVSEVRNAIHTCALLLISLKAMHQHVKEQEREKEDAVNDLFKKLGLKGE